MFEKKLNLKQFLLLNFLLIGCIWAARWYLQGPLYQEGPSEQIYLAAKNLLSGGDFHLEQYEVYHRFLTRKTETEQCSFWQDMYSLDRNNRRIVKHSHLMIVLLVPFLWLFGEWGLLVIGALSFLGVQSGMYLVARRVLGSDISFAACLMITLGTPFIYRVIGTDYDMLAATFLMLAIWLGKYASLCSGALIGLTVFFRATNLFYFPFVSFPGRNFTARASWYAFAGFLLSFAAFLLYNQIVWGGPFVTAHARMPNYINGQVVFSSAPTHFSWSIFKADWYSKLFSLKSGLLPYNLGLLPLLALPLVWRKLNCQREIGLFILAALFQAALMFSYEGWGESYWGNRYLLPANALLAVIAVVVFEQLRSNLRKSSE